MKKLQKQNAITLIALVVTIIVLLILAGISITMLTGQNGILNRAGEAKEKTDVAQKDENSKLTNYENIMNMYESGDNYVPIEDISDEIDGLPEKKTAEQLAGYIPIYTKEQFAKIASGETCAITDLSGNSKGSYTMAVDAKYALMNDLDFQNASTKPIKNFKGEFEGNGCIISNLNIDTTEDTSYTRPDGKNLSTAPAALFESVVNGKISNLAVTNSSFKSSESKAAIVGQGNNVTIENCYSKNNVFVDATNDGRASGSIIGYVYVNGANINNCKGIYSICESERQWAFGGICGASEGDITINNCKYFGDGSDDYQISSGIIDCAGRNANITNCRVQNVNTIFSGIISKRARILSEDYYNTYNLNITNCSAKDIKSNYSGIIYYSENATNKISNCKVENIKIENKENERKSYPVTGGIAATIGSECYIENCSVKNTESIRSSSYGGIIGSFFNTWLKKEAVIKNCSVEDVNLSCNSTFGGMIGVSTESTKIQNCKVNNVKCDDDFTYGAKGRNCRKYSP